MNTRLQMTSVEKMIRMPAWRSVSPKKRNTRPPYTSRTIVLVKRPISPVDASHSRGRARNSFTGRPRSLDHEDLRMGGQQRLREDVVERADPQEGDHDSFVDRAAHPLGAARRRHALVAAHD